jgi:hypothetical protein
MASTMLKVIKNNINTKSNITFDEMTYLIRLLDHAEIQHLAEYICDDVLLYSDDYDGYHDSKLILDVLQYIIDLYTPFINEEKLLEIESKRIKQETDDIEKLIEVKKEQYERLYKRFIDEISAQKKTINVLEANLHKHVVKHVSNMINNCNITL